VKGEVGLGLVWADMGRTGRCYWVKRKNSRWAAMGFGPN
jgi:hypothetical protein